MRNHAVVEVHHHISEAKASEGTKACREGYIHRPLNGETDEKVPAEEADGPGDTNFRLSLLREHHEDVHDEEDAGDNREGSHDEEQLRGLRPEPLRLRDTFLLDLLYREVPAMFRNDEPKVERHAIRVDNSIRNSSPVRHFDGVD